MKLKEFVETMISKNMHLALDKSLLTDLIQLESIEQKWNIYFGVKLDIHIIPNVEKEEGRFFGKSLIESINNGKE